MFNNNINKPAITVFLPLTSAKTSFCRQKLFLPGRFFPRKKRFLPVTGKNLPTLRLMLTDSIREVICPLNLVFPSCCDLSGRR